MGIRGPLVPPRGRNREFHSRPDRIPRRVGFGYVGHAAYYGQVGPRRARKIGRPTMTRKGRLKRVFHRYRSFRRIPRVNVGYGSEGLHQAVAPAFGV